MTTNWDQIVAMLDDGATQMEVAERTGISQSWISRKVRHMRGASWEDLDAGRNARRRVRNDAATEGE